MYRFCFYKHDITLYICSENCFLFLKDWEAWHAAIHGVERVGLDRETEKQQLEQTPIKKKRRPKILLPPSLPPFLPYQLFPHITSIRGGGA